MSHFYKNQVNQFANVNFSHKNNTSHHDRHSANDKTLFTIDPDLEINSKEETKVHHKNSDEESEPDETGYMTPRSDLSVVEDDEGEFAFYGV